MEQLTDVLLVVNPISGDTDKRDLILKVEAQAIQRNLNLKIYRTSGNHDSERITEVLDSFQAQRVLVAGGDGTIKMLAETLRDRHISIGILPTGSANGLAYNLGISEVHEKAIDTALGKRLRVIDVICVNNDLCLHVGDLGLNAELIKNYDEGQIRGKIGYALQSIPTLLQSNMPFTFDITTDQGNMVSDGILLGIANARHYGTGATINPNGRVDDGKFEVLIYKKLDIIEFARMLRQETEFDYDFMESIHTTRLQVHCPIPVPFQLDGEYYGEIDQLEAFILPKHLRVAV